MPPSIEEGLMSPPPISLYLERDGGHSWFSCLKLLNTDHLPGFDLPHNCLRNSLLSEQQLRSPFCSGSFWKRVVFSFLWDLKCFSSDHGGAPAQTKWLLQTSVIDICDGHDHFLIHDVYSVQGQVITVLEKWITHAGHKRHQQELQHPSCMWPVNYETCHGEKLKSGWNGTQLLNHLWYFGSSNHPSSECHQASCSESFHPVQGQAAMQTAEDVLL